MLSLQFLLTTLVVVLAPGTGVIYTIATGLGRGRQAAIWAALGCTFGIVPHLLAATLGLAALLHTSALLFQIVKFAGVAYLLYLAWQMLRSEGALSVGAETTTQSGFRIARRGALINILNPKLSIFFFAFLPQFISADEAQPLSRMVEMSVVFMALTFVVFVGYGVFAARIRRHIISRPQVLTWMRRVFAGAFVALGVKLALAER